MQTNKQHRAPFVEALEGYCRQGFTAFHTPGHKLGRGASDYQKDLFGSALRRDLGLMYALDDLFQPEGPLKEAMDLAAQLYGAGRTFFSINGTTACVEAMILATCHDGDEIIIPREAHKSVLGGIVLSGAVPVYMKSHFADDEQVSLGPSLTDLKEAVDAHPLAKAVVLTYPTYDGICVPLREMAAYAHEHGMYVLVDEAHGAHLHFSRELPRDALACGADCVAQSTHKLVGSLTQTSMLHCRKGFPETEAVARAMHLVQSTSPHYWFLASLDSARQQLAEEGPQRVERALRLAQTLRQELNELPGIYSFDWDIVEKYPQLSDFDETKVTIDFSGMGLNGVQAEKLLRKHQIEVELTAGNHVLALITIGDDEATIQRLFDACEDISLNYTPRGALVTSRDLALPDPVVAVTPRQAYWARREAVPLAKAVGRIAAETVTFYPPGIPVLSPGEEVTPEVLVYIQTMMENKYKPNGPADPRLRTLEVLQ